MEWAGRLDRHGRRDARASMNRIPSTTSPHRRFNPLTQEWVLVAPDRTQRPWEGQLESIPTPAQVAYDAACYLCPGNVRAGGEKNPAYTGTFVFDNDFAALRPETQAWEVDEQGLLIARSEAGQCRVLCFSPRHDLTLARMAVMEVRLVVDTWCHEFYKLGSEPRIRSVQIF